MTLNPSFDAVCWTAHFFIGMSIALWFVVCGWSPWWGLLAVAAWSLPKDLCWDLNVETTTWQGELTDVITYLAGALVTASLVLTFQGN